MSDSLLKNAVDDNQLFFSPEGLNQLVFLSQKSNKAEVRGIFSRTESVEDSLGTMISEQFQSQVTLPTKSLPSWFSQQSKIGVQDAIGIQHEYAIEKMQHDDMLARVHVWLKKIGSKEIPV